MNQNVTLYRIIKLFEDYQKSQQNIGLNGFGYGNLIDFGQNLTGGTQTNYPFMFVTPQLINYNENITTYTMSIIFADRLNDDKSNMVDVQSDMSIQAKRLMGWIRRGIDNTPDLFDNMDVTIPVAGIPFLERFNDYVGGIAIDAEIIVQESIDSCNYYESVVPCPDEPIQQYLTTTISGSDIILDLYSDSGTTSGTTALCNYSYSGWVQGDLGTIVLYDGFIQEGQTSKTIDTTSIFSGETLSASSLYNITTTSCDCPTNINFTQTSPIYITEYQSILTAGVSTWGYEAPYITEQIKQNNLVKELLDNDIFNRLNGFYLFKLDTTNGGSPDWTLIDWTQPTISNQRALLDVSVGVSNFPQFVSNKGWRLAPRNCISIPQISTNLTTTGNTEGTYMVDVFDPPNPSPSSIFYNLWGTNNNQWNRAIYGNTKRHSIFRGIELVDDYDFTGLGFKSATIDGLIGVDTTIVFNNNGVLTSRQKTGVDVGIGGGVLSINGRPDLGPFGFNWTTGIWFNGINMSSSLTQTFQQIITNYFNS